MGYICPVQAYIGESPEMDNTEITLYRNNNMLLTKKLTIRVTSNMCKYYRNLGYKFKCNDKIEIDIATV